MHKVNYEYSDTAPYDTNCLKTDLSKLEGKLNENPVGSLQEMCVREKWAPPLYALEEAAGMPHDRQFTISCKVLSYCETGVGKSKKKAKKMAALKMYQVLQEISNQTDEVKDRKDREIESIPAEILEKRFSPLKDCTINTIPKDVAFACKLVQFEMYLRESDSEKLEELHKVAISPTQFDCVKFLQDLAKELQFEITYVDVDEKSINGKYQCLLQISTAPLVVCYGTGKSVKEAQMSAAFNALEYVKITTRKWY